LGKKDRGLKGNDTSFSDFTRNQLSVSFEDQAHRDRRAIRARSAEIATCPMILFYLFDIEMEGIESYCSRELGCENPPDPNAQEVFTYTRSLIPCSSNQMTLKLAREGRLYTISMGKSSIERNTRYAGYRYVW
jgi:hypothetical protein